MSIKLSNQYDLLCDFVDPADTHAHESQNKQQLLQIVHQIVNRKEQGLCHVHLDDRLVLLIGNSVYDFHLHNEN